MANSRQIFEDTLRGLFIGGFIGDALAMPAHYYMDTSMIIRDFGVNGINGYVKPRKYNGNGMIMNDSDGVVGHILHDDCKQYWLNGKVYGYHASLNAGDNTLECEIIKNVVILHLIYDYNIIFKGEFVFDSDKYIKRYVKYMTTKNSHHDTYVYNSHRVFFKKYFNKNGIYNECNVDDMNALVYLPVFVCYLFIYKVC